MIFEIFDYIISTKMIDLFKQIDFSNELDNIPELRLFLVEACKKIEQEDADYLRKIKKPELDDELNNQFIVSGIPQLTTEKVEKFKKVFKDNLLAKREIGEANGLVDISLGMDKGVGNQTAYLSYKTAAEAKVAFNKLNNLKLDPKHPMSCIWANEVRNVIEIEQEALGEYKVPKLIASKEKVEHNLDQESRSQFLLRQDKLVYLQWLDHLDKSAKSTFASEYLQMGYAIHKMIFSPMGTYLAVCTNQGVHLHYGNNLQQKCLLRHVNAVDAKFSPDQRYIISSNGNMRKNRQNFIFWAVEQEIKLKSYRSHGNQTLDSFEFASDSGYIAISSQHEVTFFTLASTQELLKQLKAPEEEQHIIQAAHIQKMSWLKSNKEIIIMCYELDYNPISPPSTRIFIYHAVNKTQKKWRAWGQHAKNGQIHVSEKGQWVGIALRKFLKKGHFGTVIQIGNLLKKEQSIEINTIQLKEDVGNISWDSINNRIAAIYKDESIKSINIRYIVSFYELSIRQKSIEVTKIGQLKNNLQNRVVLTNNGAFFALYNITDDSAEKGRFSLGLITKENKEKGKRSVNFEFTKQNLMVNGMNFFQVDDSGRFILLGTEKGYQIWNFIGQIIIKDTLQKNIHNVQWRPRMFVRLNEVQEKKMLEQEKDIRKKYEIIDDKRINHLKWAKEQAKKQRKLKFLEFVQAKQAWYKQFVDKREKILGFKQFDARTAVYEVQQKFIDLQ